MSYLVLARKYRPLAFEEMIGQEHVTRALQNGIAQGRLHHAFLFTGARGVGKTTCARILAKALSCEKAPTSTPCNQCAECVEITQGHSVDVQEIDAASNNGVDNIRELRDAIVYAPQRGKKKVYILDEVHMLSSGAWNALLKTLEEPPPHAIFVFATTDPHKLPATILSRVQRYDFKLLATRLIAEQLGKILQREGLAFDEAALMLVARQAQGSVRDALSLADQVLASIGDERISELRVAEILGVADRALLQCLGRAVLDKDGEAALQALKLAIERGYDLSDLAHALCGYFRDLLMVQTVKEPAQLVEVSPGDLEELQQTAKTVQSGLIEMLFHRLTRSAEAIARSPLQRYVFEVALIELCHVEPLESLETLVTKLAELEKNSGQSSGAGLSSGPSPSPMRNSPTATDSATATAATMSYPELVEKVLASEPRLSILAQSRLVEWSESKLVVTFDGDFAAEGLRERLPQFKQAIKQVSGKELAIEITVGAQGMRKEIASESLLEVEQRKVEDERDVRRKEALDHPARRILDEKFGGTWKDPVLDNLPDNLPKDLPGKLLEESS